MQCFPDNGSSQVVNSRKGMGKCVHSLCKTSASLCMVERGTLSHYHQHLFSGLSKFAHPQPRIPDNWPFNGSPQCNTVCAQADCNQSPSFQRDNSYLFSAERIAPTPCVGAICCFLLLWFAFIHFQHSLNAAIVCC